MNASYRTRRLLAVAAVTVAVAIALPRFLTHTPYARIGAEVDYDTPNHVGRISNVVGPPSRGLLRKGDLLLSVDGHPGTREEFDKLKPKGGLKMRFHSCQ